MFFIISGKLQVHPKIFSGKKKLFKNETHKILNFMSVS